MWWVWFGWVELEIAMESYDQLVQLLAFSTHTHTHTHAHTHSHTLTHAHTHTHSYTHTHPSPQTERDVSVRQRAIDLLYAMCDHTNAQTIVEELLHYLEKADYSIRETLV